MNASMQFGKAIEYAVMSKLLRAGREVYMPVVDDHGVDLIVRTQNHDLSSDEFQEIQVKSGAKGTLFAAISCPNPRPNYWFVFYSDTLGLYWLVNSMDFVKLASQNVTGKSIGKYSLGTALKSGKSRTPLLPYLTTDFSQLP